MFSVRFQVVKAIYSCRLVIIIILSAHCAHELCTAKVMPKYKTRDKKNYSIELQRFF